VANLAADELIGRGFKTFAFCGFPGLVHSDLRCEHFVARLLAEGFQVEVYRVSQRRRSTNILATLNRGILDEEPLAAWLSTLPKPVGLMTPNDVRAQQVLNACARCGIAVPDEVAVIGVDNDDVLCEMSDPPLSSVALNGQKIGYEAAALLDGMVNGRPPSSRHISVAPLDVIARQSTDVLAISDPIVARAKHFIRLHACEGIGVERILTEMSLSRRALERRFQKATGRSPGDEIARVRLSRIKELLSTTDFSLWKIAGLTGFQYIETMHYFFKENAGLTPGQYRKKQL
jgi:LacI family transcriptional regulator